MPLHVLISGMATQAGFELYAFEQDMDTDCGSNPRGTPGVPRCTWRRGGRAKYVHFLFRRAAQRRVFGEGGGPPSREAVELRS